MNKMGMCLASDLILICDRLSITETSMMQEVREGRSQMNSLTAQWYKDVRAAPTDSEGEDDDDEITLLTTNHSHVDN